MHFGGVEVKWDGREWEIVNGMSPSLKSHEFLLLLLLLLLLLPLLLLLMLTAQSNFLDIREIATFGNGLFYPPALSQNTHNWFIYEARKIQHHTP
jgi:hypothetical protein